MRTQEAHRRKAACPSAWPARGDAQRNSANFPFQSQSCRRVPTCTWGSRFQDRYPHVSQRWRLTSHISTNTHCTCPGRRVKCLPPAESQRNLRNFTWQLGSKSREKDLSHRCPGQGTAVDTMSNPPRISMYQPSAAPGISAYTALFSYWFDDQMNMHSMSILKALNVNNEPFYKSKF